MSAPAKSPANKAAGKQKQKQHARWVATLQNGKPATLRSRQASSVAQRGLAPTLPKLKFLKDDTA